MKSTVNYGKVSYAQFNVYCCIFNRSVSEWQHLVVQIQLLFCLPNEIEIIIFHINIMLVYKSTLCWKNSPGLKRTDE